MQAGTRLVHSVQSKISYRQFESEVSGTVKMAGRVHLPGQEHDAFEVLWTDTITTRPNQHQHQPAWEKENTNRNAEQNHIHAHFFLLAAPPLIPPTTTHLPISIITISSISITITITITITDFVKNNLIDLPF